MSNKIFIQIYIQLVIFVYICRNFNSDDMISIITNNGSLMNTDDSRQYIKYKLKEQFANFSEFAHCNDVKFPDYWGDHILHGSEKDYQLWISEIAKHIF